MSRKNGSFNLRYEFLDRLRGGALPMEFHDPEDIDSLQALSSSKLIEVRFPELVRGRDGYRYDGPATVLKLTVLGRAVAARYVQFRPRRGRPALP